MNNCLEKKKEMVSHRSKNPYCLAFTALLLCIIGDEKRICCFCPLKNVFLSRLWHGRCIINGAGHSIQKLQSSQGHQGQEVLSLQVLWIFVSQYTVTDPAMALLVVPWFRLPSFSPSAPHHSPIFKTSSNIIRIKQRQQQQKQQSKEAFNGVNSSHISTARGLEGPFHSSVVWEKAVRKEEKGWSSGEICGRNGLDRQQSCFLLTFL